MSRAEPGQAGEGSLLDRHLPEWHFNEVHRRRLAVPPARALELSLDLRIGDLPLSGTLMSLRLAPTALGARSWPFRRRRSWIDLALELGFVELDRNERELVLGAIGRFWRLREELEPLPTATAFRRFDAPGYAKGAINLHARDAGTGTELVTETRIWTTDDRAYKAFRLYWLPVRAAGGLIRRELLAAVARHARRGG